MTTEMCVTGTPVEDRRAELGLLVKREDLSCPPPGPPFSKTRGVFRHVRSRPELVIGVLDTNHSQGGWAVARACQLLGKRCVDFYPVRKSEQWDALKPQQQEARELGAQLVPLPAGRSAILYHRARSMLAAGGAPAYLMPNALKLPESVEETAREVGRTDLQGVRTVLVSASSGTIAAGVLRGLVERGWSGDLVVHLGYSRPEGAVVDYLYRMAHIASPYISLVVVDQGYAYADESTPTDELPFPANRYYDKKAVAWWLSVGRQQYGEALLWLIG